MCYGDKKPKKMATTPTTERLPEEHFGAWTAFLVYRDSKPRRSMPRVLELLTEQHTPKDPPIPSVRTLQRWRTDFRWDERCADYDRQCSVALEDAERIRVIEEQIRNAKVEWWDEHDAKISDLQSFQVKIGNHLAAMGLTALEKIYALVKSSMLESKLAESNLSQIAAFMAASQKLIEEGLALRERALAVDEILAVWQKREMISATATISIPAPEKYHSPEPEPKPKGRRIKRKTKPS